MKSNIGIIISREFSERVAKKSFLITTLLMPVFMLLMMAAPALIMTWSTPSERTIAVIDDSGIVFPVLEKEAAAIDYLTLESVSMPLDSALADSRYDGVLTIGAGIVDNPKAQGLYLHDAGVLDMEKTFTRTIEDVIETERLKNYNIENLDKIMAEVNVDVSLNTVRINEDGEGESTSSMVSYFLGMAMTFILYMFLLLYGQMVMTSIIEEKNNRVLELVVSSVKPLQLMLGKIIGVGLVAVVQVTLWGVLICLMSAFVLPMLMPEPVAEQVTLFNAGGFDAATSAVDPDMVQALALFSSVGYLAKLFFYVLLFLVGGFLFYASIFAAIGSAVDNIQDASQFQSFAVVPIIIALVFSLSVANDPNTVTALWLSMIPFTSPMVMLARIPFNIAPWEIWTSLVVLYVSFVGMAWISAKIYRVGIFMYGRKPTFKDLVRWARYK
ncbi:MAG: ABC transporter permease [Muribaculaceae bacterium]|nr:ABC transporter permease [Muribaculaceae bacterium]